MRLLNIRNLRTTFDIHVGSIQAVRGVDLYVDEGETIGIVGESGSGKSVSMLSLLRLLPNYTRIESESITFAGQELKNASIRQLRKLSGNQIGMVFQDPLTCLNPLLSVGHQLMEPLKIHKKMNKAEAYARSVEMLKTVDMPDPESRMKQYPHELSGGMRQRVMIAIAVASDPRLVIADEPTTALDVTIQAQILALMQNLQSRRNMATIMITHDLGVIAGMCSRVMVMYGGCIVEEGASREVFYAPRHPYTWGLLRSIPQKSGGKQKLIPIPGSPPDLIAPPPGCPFEPRCPHAMIICRTQMPAHRPLSDTHKVRCYLLDESAPKVQWGGATC